MALLTFVFLALTTGVYALDKQVSISANLRQAFVVHVPPKNGPGEPAPFATLQISGTQVLSI